MNLSSKELSLQIHKKINKIIWSEQIGAKRISYCNLSKQSQTALFKNQRFFLLVHGQYFGYRYPLTQDQLLPFGSIDRLPELKYKIPLNKIMRLETNSEDTIVVTFQFGNVPKKWIIQCPSESTAQYLLQLLTNQCKLRKKGGPKFGSSLHNKQSERQPIFDNKNQSSKKKQKSHSNQDMSNIYAKSEQKSYFYNQIKKSEEQNDFQKSELKKQISRLTQELNTRKNKQSELIPDYKREEQKDLLIKQIESYKKKCLQHEEQISILRKKLKQREGQIINLQNKLMNK